MGVGEMILTEVSDENALSVGRVTNFFEDDCTGTMGVGEGVKG